MALVEENIKKSSETIVEEKNTKIQDSNDSITHTESIKQKTEKTNTPKETSNNSAKLASGKELFETTDSKNNNSLKDKCDQLCQKAKTCFNNKINKIKNTDPKEVGQKIFTWLKNPYSLAFLVVLILAINFRLKFFAGESLWNDAAVHLWFVQKAIMHPLTIFSYNYMLGDYATIHILMTAVEIFINNIFVSAKIVALLFSILGIIFTYKLGIVIRNKTVGIVAAILVAFNGLLFFYNTRILADAPLVTMFIISCYFLVKSEKENSLKDGVLGGIFLLLTVLTKRQAIIFPVALFVYYLVKYRLKAFTDKKILASWGISWGIPFIGSLVLWPITGTNYLNTLFVKKLFSLDGVYKESFSVVSMLNHVIGNWIIIAGIIGFLIMLFYKKKHAILPVVLTLAYGIWFELGVGMPLDRYLLVLIPITAIMAAVAIDEVGEFIKLFTKIKFISFVFAIGVAILLVIPSFNFGMALTEQKSYSYTGYQEASDWINNNAPEDSVLFAGSPRMMRAFTARPYLIELSRDYSADPSGTIVNLRDDRFLNNQSLFESELLRYYEDGHEIYLEIDMWEYTQAGWYYPLSQESINLFQSLGFELVYVVNRQQLTSSGLQDLSAIFLFKYNGPIEIAELVIEEMVNEEVSEEELETEEITETVEEETESLDSTDTNETN